MVANQKTSHHLKPPGAEVRAETRAIHHCGAGVAANPWTGGSLRSWAFGRAWPAGWTCISSRCSHGDASSCLSRRFRVVSIARLIGSGFQRGQVRRCGLLDLARSQKDFWPRGDSR